MHADGADAQLVGGTHEVAGLHESQEDFEPAKGDLFIDAD
jgi:hypothetical protein